MEIHLSASTEEIIEEKPEEPGGADKAIPDPRLKLHPQFHSRFLRDDRDLIVYLPPGYDDEFGRRYPVLYMHDGQNLFDPATSYIPGRTWQMRETTDLLVAKGEIDPLIIVGIYNTGNRRLAEYTHARDWKRNGGDADKYGRLLTGELKPFIDSEYRTLPDRANTAMGGSSLGGLVTLYLGLKNADTYGRLAVLSPSVWWNHKSILAHVNEYEGPPWPRMWLDIGDREGRRSLPDADLLYKRLLANGWKPEVDIHYERVRGGTHDEASWAMRVGPMLKFLFAP